MIVSECLHVLDKGARIAVIARNLEGCPSQVSYRFCKTPDGRLLLVRKAEETKECVFHFPALNTASLKEPSRRERVSEGGYRQTPYRVPVSRHL